MAANTWKKIIYRLIPGTDSDGIDVEANTKASGSNSEQSKDLIEMESFKPLTKSLSVNDPNNSNGVQSENGQLNSDNNDVENISNVHRDNLSNTKGNKNKPYRDSEAHPLARNGDVDKCLHVLSRPGVDINVRGNNGMSALHLAAQNGHADLLKELLKLGADRYLQDIDECIPLHYAASRGYLECVELLLEECERDDEQLPIESNTGKTALMEAAESGHQDCCKMVLRSNIDKVDKKGHTALIFAVKMDHKVIAQFLIDNGANPTKPNNLGITPMHEAATHKSRGLLELLYESVGGDDVFQVDAKGRSILHFAVTHKNGDCLKYLLEKECVKANIDKWDGPIGTPLLYAMYCTSTDCVFELLKAGASITAGCDGTYPIHRAAERGYDSICEKFLEINSSLLSQRNELKQTPLHVAAKSGKIKTVNLLISRIEYAKISPSAEDVNGQTPLHVSIKKADDKVISALIKGNISVVKQDAEGFTALHLAAEMGKTSICELLVKRARSNLYKCSTKESGFFPLDLAFKDMKINEKTIIYLLRESSNGNQAQLSKLLNGRMIKHMKKALDKNQRTIVESILESPFWEYSLFGGCNLQPKNFKKLVTAYPDLALKVQGKLIDSKSRDNPIYGFKQFEDTYYMQGETTAFDENTGKLNSKDVYSWVKDHVVNLMISNNECELLKHPLTQAWLRRKWEAYIRHIHYSLLVLDGLYLAAIICLMSTTWNWFHITHNFNVSKEEFCEAAKHLYGNFEASEDPGTLDSNVTDAIRRFEERVGPYTGFYYLLIVTWIVKVILEIYYMARLKHLYWAFEMLPQTLVELSQLICTMLLIFSPLGMCYQQHLGLLQEVYAWQFGIFSVIFGWLHLINSLNQARTSVFMPITKDFLEILLKVVYFLVYFIAIFAFVFYLLLSEQKAFSSIFQSLGSTIVWMLLDLGYVDTFVDQEQFYPILSNIIFFIFITTIGVLVVSLINKERTVKANGKQLDDDYRRLVIYTRLIFRYDICFPECRRWFAVNKYNNSDWKLTKYEETSAAKQDNKEIVERINELDSKLTEISEQVTKILKKLSKITDKKE